jgi:translation initiation factor IF-2
MPSGSKPKRLFKVAQEFNVGTPSIVEALAKHDYKIDNKPNTKITPEMYAVLEQEYGQDKKSKQDHERSREAYEERRAQIRETKGESVTLDSILEPEDMLTPEDEIVPEPEPEAKEETPEQKTEAAEPEKQEAEAETKPEPEKTEDKPGEEAAEKETKQEKEDVQAAEETQAEVEEDEEEPAEEVEEEIIRGRSDKLRGTTVLGKIQLKTADADDDSGKKGRRKKKKTKTRDEEEVKPKKKAVKQPAEEEESESQKRKKKKKRIRKTLEKPKVSEEEIESKIRETISSIQTGSKGKQRQKRRRQKRDEMAEKRELEAQIMEEESAIVEVTEFVTVSDLADLLNVSSTDVITSCMQLGLMVSINQRLDANTIELIADEFDKEVKFVDADTVAEDILLEEEDDEEDLEPRAPVVTVMGHVDHGKTSLLDFIKKTKVAEGEAGGITQHIGAYAVDLPDGRKISFLDTPGHEAFTAMRARGAQVTDIVILVVAADDSVMPQTIEAINHAQAAGVSIVVAINKMDKEGAQPDKIMQQLSEHNVLVEDWGGNVQCTKVSAHTGEGIDDLLDKVLIEAELLELKANPERNASGIVLETKLDKGKGVVGNLLIQKGKLKVGDTFVAGNHYGRIRAMENEFGQRIKEAGPSMPVQVTGFDGAPQAGDKFIVTKDEKTAKEIAVKRQQIKREQDMRKVKHVTLDDIARRMSIGEVSELNIIIKGDVDGSIEALSGSLIKLSTEEVKVNIIHTGVGAISESDVLLASASDAIIIGFQVRPTANARKLAEKEEIDIRLFSIIYEAVDLVHDALEGMLSPELSEKITANVEVRDTFKVPGTGMIAGCYVLDGKINRNSKVRLIRDGIVVYTGEISSLKRFKDDAKEVAAGYECGVGIKNFNDIKVGDIIESYEVVEKKRKLVVDKP